MGVGSSILWDSIGLGSLVRRSLPRATATRPRIRSFFGIARTASGCKLGHLMGRQWLHAKRAIVNLKKGQTVGKIVKEITVAAKLGGGDPAGNARLFAVLEKARKASVTRDAIERAISDRKSVV